MSILQDISNYQYEKMVVKSMQLLTKYYSAKTDLFTKAVQARVNSQPSKHEAGVGIMLAQH